MRLAALLREIERSPGAVTVAELARRLDATPAATAAMLAALRAAGRVGPSRQHLPGTEECARSGGCAVSCPGPTSCPFTVEFGGLLEITR